MSLKVSELKKMCDYILKNYGDTEVQSLYVTKMGDKFYDVINDCNMFADGNVFTLVTDKRVSDKRVDHKRITGTREKKIQSDNTSQRNLRF